MRSLSAVGLAGSLAISTFSNACQSARRASEPVIIFSTVPVADRGGAESLELIRGRVLRAEPGRRIVLYAYSLGVWWLQPFISHPFTEIKSDSTWQSSIHLGERYAALVVESSYKPSAKLPGLPARGGAILAIATVPGRPYRPKVIHFSGYDWEARQLSNDRGGKLNPYDPANARVDQAGFLHLKIVRRENQWFCSDVRLTQSLGRGLYQFTVRDLSHLDPAVAMTMYTFDRDSRFNRELDVELSRWGDPGSRNGQFVIQPYHEPSNVSRFEAPPGMLTFSFLWSPGRVVFDIARGHAAAGTRSVAEHAFTSGVPLPGGESIHISLFAYGKSHIPIKDPAEVIVENFTYTP